MLQSGSRRVRERAALGLASALHIAALLGLGAWAINRERSTARTPTPRAALQAGERDREIEVEFELDFGAIERGPAPAVAGAAELGPVAARALASASGTRAHRAPFQAPARSPNPDRSEGSEGSAPARAGDADSAAGSDAAAHQEGATSSIDLGLEQDAWQRWIGSAKSDTPPAQAAAARSDRRRVFHAPPKSTTGGLQEGLEAHDRALGLGPSGPMVSALYNAAHTSAAPQLGVARFQVTVLESGVVEIALTAASDQLDGWRAVAAQAADALRRSPPRIPGNRSGIRLSIELTAEETLPNGVRTKQLHGPRPTVSPVRFVSTQEAQADLKDRNPVAGENKQLAEGTKANVDVPGVYVAATGKVCSYRLGLSVLGLPVFDGGCDPSNIGAKPRRMVRTRVREEVLF
ncbi:MAG TPA: hypothetical protein VGC79_18430 [Polyangiaceae bacterium]